MAVKWKNGKRFAFTFCDDTDFAQLETVRPIYDLLDRLGMRTTKLVWIREGGEGGRNRGDTCEREEYVDWLRSLHDRGFEIGLHNVAPSTSTRPQIVEGLARFQELFGRYPSIHCNHTGCLDNLYWGAERLTGWRRKLYQIWTRGRGAGTSFGHDKCTEHFWGDICEDRIRYVRNFTFDKVNTLKYCPDMPYHDPSRPYVNYWFAATNASSPKYFRQNFSLENVNRLVDEGGLCIAYVHFGARYYREGKIDEYFQRVMDHISSQDGWFAPVSEILDHLRGDSGTKDRAISGSDLRKLELRWMVQKFGKKTGI
jgi:hypothetical protein